MEERNKEKRIVMCFRSICCLFKKKDNKEICYNIVMFIRSDIMFFFNNYWILKLGFGY